MLGLGIVDCDTSHVYQFARRLNHVDVEPDQWVDGARVVAAYPGVSRITDPSRIDEYLAALRAAQVELVARPEDLLGRIDAVLIESNEGAVHRDRATPFIEAGLPTFIDKPLASSTDDARALLELAASHGVPLLSASALRFTSEIQQVRADEVGLGSLVGVDVFSPAPLHQHNPGLFHYGVHGVEMLYALLGSGCAEVSCTFQENGEVVTGRWLDGRLGVLRGLRRGIRGYGFTAYGERAIRQSSVDLTYMYRDLVRAIVSALSGRPMPISATEMVEVVAFQEAALASARTGGRPIAVRP